MHIKEWNQKTTTGFYQYPSLFFSGIALVLNSTLPLTQVELTKRIAPVLSGQKN